MKEKIEKIIWNIWERSLVNSKREGRRKQLKECDKLIEK
jgi:hypothetical protein